MTVDKTVTPLPSQEFTPIQVEVADWLDLSSNTEEQIMETTFSNQILEVNRIGGRPETDVDISVVGVSETSTSRGQTTSRETVDAEAINTFGMTAKGGPVATERLEWSVDNSSGTNHTQAQMGQSPYQTHINYTIRRLTVAEKIRRGISLQSTLENNLADEFNLRSRNSFGLPPDLSNVLRTDMEDKVVVKNETSTELFNIQNSGETAGIRVARESNLRDRGLVAYLTGIGVNSQNYTLSGSDIYVDDLTFDIERNGFEFYKLELPGMPGIGSEPRYHADTFIPFTEEMEINLFSQNQTPSNIDVQLEYKLVRRTLLEQALLGLDEEIEQGSDRARVYNELVTRMRAGVGVREYIDDSLEIGPVE